MAPTRDERGRVVGCQRRGTNPPYGDVNDSREIEYDGTGQIVRVYWCHPDGRRDLDFERPARETTLRACRQALLEELVDAVVLSLRSANIVDEVYAVVLSHCEAEYQHRLPPHVGVGLASECRQLIEKHGKAAPEHIWNPDSRATVKVRT